MCILHLSDYEAELLRRLINHHVAQVNAARKPAFFELSVAEDLATILERLTRAD